MSIHPTQLYAVFAETLTLGFILMVEKNRSGSNIFSKLYSKPGDIFYFSVLFQAASVFLIEIGSDLKAS